MCLIQVRPGSRLQVEDTVRESVTVRLLPCDTARRTAIFCESALISLRRRVTQYCLGERPTEAPLLFECYLTRATVRGTHPPQMPSRSCSHTS